MLVGDWPFLKSDGPLGAYSVAETGIYAVQAFKNPNKWLSKIILIHTIFTLTSLRNPYSDKDIKVISDIITPKDVVAIISEYAKKPVHLKEVSTEAFGALKGVPQMHEFWAKYVPTSPTINDT